MSWQSSLQITKSLHVSFSVGMVLHIHIVCAFRAPGWHTGHHVICILHVSKRTWWDCTLIMIPSQVCSSALSIIPLTIPLTGLALDNNVKVYSVYTGRYTNYWVQSLFTHWKHCSHKDTFHVLWPLPWELHAAVTERVRVQSTHMILHL